MLARIRSYGLMGIQGFPVDVETDISKGQPMVDVVGLPDAAVRESLQRVRIALKNSGYQFPPSRVTINLAPADVRKEGPLYDLAMAVGVLMATGQIPASIGDNCIFLGELSLNGDLRPVSGIMPMLIDARERGFKYAVVPRGNAHEASYIEGVSVMAPASLSELVDHCKKTSRLTFVPYKKYVPTASSDANDFSLIKGQFVAKRAAEIAAAGGHNLLLIGSPGSGKTMLARSIPGILPDMTLDEALTTAKIHSVAGLLKAQEEGISLARPFRSPHHTASVASIIGGGSKAAPGEVSLAHNGVLFLDELPEFRRDVLESMRQPLEDGFVTIARANARLTYPSRFMLIAAMNPCPCGNFGSKDGRCTCTKSARDKYLRRISGPLLERIDLHIGVDRPDFEFLSKNAKPEEPSELVRDRVNTARRIQLRRYEGTGIFCNAQLRGQLFSTHCSIDDESEELMKKVFQQRNMSPRAFTRTLLIARTIADLEWSEYIEKRHVAEALQYRMPENSYWGGDMVNDGNKLGPTLDEIIDERRNRIN